jgi:hypothetical protein
MRHSSISITVDVYGHLVPGANWAAVNRLDERPTGTTIRNLDATPPIVSISGRYGSH